MSQVYAWPSASPGADGVAQDRSSRLDAARADLAPGLLLRGFPQALDLFVCAIAAVAVFPRVFFAALTPSAGLAVALAVCALPYVAAPLAAPLFAALERRCGAGARFVAGRLLFAAATLAIGLLPAAGQAVWPAALLVAFRLLQGLGIGGLAASRGAGPARLAAVAAPALAGLAAAAGLLGVMAVVLPAADFLTWGWRYPFVVGLAGNMAALFADLRLHTRAASARPDGRPALRLVAVGGAPVAPRR
jgi:MFS family permease